MHGLKERALGLFWGIIATLAAFFFRYSLVSWKAKQYDECKKRCGVCPTKDEWVCAVPGPVKPPNE